MLTFNKIKKFRKYWINNVMVSADPSAPSRIEDIVVNNTEHREFEVKSDNEQCDFNDCDDTQNITTVEIL